MICGLAQDLISPPYLPILCFLISLSSSICFFYCLYFLAAIGGGLMNYRSCTVMRAINGYRHGKGYHKHICLSLVVECV